MSQKKHEIEQNEVPAVLAKEKEGVTRQLSEGAMDFDMHAQYLDQLYRQYNIKVDNALLFYVGSDPEPMIFVEKRDIDIGRQDSGGHITPEMDLNKYDGNLLGVSRVHAQIKFREGKYLVQDLHSTNGTWLDGNRLVPYQRYELQDGSMLQFGRLMTRVFVIQR
ncbi:MAG: FHA domain-containing protein [Chloroflexota bacterium]